MNEFLKEPAFSEHAGGRCPAHECAAYMVYIIRPERCIMCGDCQAVCGFHAIIGEKRVAYFSGYQPFEIAVKRCTRCGECLKVCPNNAIEAGERKDGMVKADT